MKRRRWTVRVAVAASLVVVSALLAALLLPGLVASMAADSIRDAIRRELPPSTAIEVAVEPTWTTSITATIALRDGDEVRAAAEVATPRGMLGWVWPLLRGRVGEVPITFAIDARLEGAAGRAWLERLGDGGDAVGVERGTSSDGEVGGERDTGRSAGVPADLAVAAAGSIDIELVDRERGLDVAIGSDRVELTLSSDRSLEAEFDLTVGRVAEAPRSEGRVRVAGVLADVLAPDGGFELAAATGSLDVEASAVAFEWNHETLAVESFSLEAGLDAAEGLGVELEASGAFGGRGAVVSSELRWRRPFEEGGRWRSDFAGLGGTGRLSGVPLAALAATLPPEIAAVVGELGTAIEAEWSLPIDGSTLTASASTDRATIEASARVERETGRLVDGAVRFDALFEGRPAGASGAPAETLEATPMPVRIAASGIEYREGEIEVATAEIFTDAAIGRLVEAIELGDSIDVLADAAIEVRADSIRWRLAEGLQALEARGRLDTDAVLRVHAPDDGPAGTLSRTRVEWFAEPLGRALSLRGEIGLDDGTIRFDERLDGLWTGREWLPASSLRPHGTASIDGLDPGLLAPLLPEASRVAWSRQSPTALDLQISTRVEGDRLEGVLRATGPSLDLRVPLSIDAQRIAIGPTEASLSVKREAIAALPQAWTGGVAIAADLEASVAVEAVLLPVEALSGRMPESPALAATLSIPALPIESAPGLDADAGLEVRDLRGRFERDPEGAVSIDGGARLARRGLPVSAESLGDLEVLVEAPGDGVAPRGRLAIVSLDAPALLPRFVFARGTVLEDPASLDWLGRLELQVETARDGGVAISARGSNLEIAAELSMGLSSMDGSTFVLEALDLAATLPPEAVMSLSENAVRSAGEVRLRAQARDVALGAPAAPRGEFTVEVDPFDLVVGGTDDPRTVPLAGHRAAMTAMTAITAITTPTIPTTTPAETKGESFAIRLGPMRGETDGATIGFEGRLSRVGTPSGWTLDGGGSVRGMPTAILDGVLGEDELIAGVLGSPFDATFACGSLGASGGELEGEANFPHGALQLPKLLVESELLQIPPESPFTGEVEFASGLAALLEDLSPMLGSIETLDAPVRLTIASATLPRAGADRDRLSGDLRLDVGRGRFRPRGVLRLALAALDDANAEGFVGEATPLVARIREGRLDYRDFEVRFLPHRDGWRNTIVSRGSIDLLSTPPRGEFTMAFPATSLVAYSSEIRRILETRPRLLESIEVPLTLRGPLDGSAPLESSIEFDPAGLIEAGLETLIDEGFRRLLEGVR